MTRTLSPGRTSPAVASVLIACVAGVFTLRAPSAQATRLVGAASDRATVVHLTTKFGVRGENDQVVVLSRVFPQLIAGDAWVYDASKRAMVGYDSAGTRLPEHPIRELFVFNAYPRTNSEFVVRGRFRGASDTLGVARATAADVPVISAYSIAITP